MEGNTAIEAKKEEATAGIEDLITETQNKKMEVFSRIENEVHFKKAFPVLSLFDFFGFGRATARSLYAEDYRAKVDVKEQQDENTMLRLNDRESRLEELILASEIETNLEQLEAMLEEIKLLSEEDKVDAKAMEETDPKYDVTVPKSEPEPQNTNSNIASKTGSFTTNSSHLVDSAKK